MPYQYYPCDDDYYTGGQSMVRSRGFTGWNQNLQFQFPSQLEKDEEATLIFTCTVPKCYNPTDTILPDGRDVCCVVFNAWPNGTDLSEDNFLRYTLNNNTIGGCHVSGVQYHGATQAFDLANTGAYYNDMGTNTFIIHNTSNSTIQIDHPRIYRTYKMCNPNAVTSGSCPTCYGGTVYCSGGKTMSTYGDFDATRQDWPCNSLSCGTSTFCLSYTTYDDDTYKNDVLLANSGNTFAWTFNFTNYTNNWQGESICLFNFNQIIPVMFGTIEQNDIALVARLNGHIIDTFFLNRHIGDGMFPSHDLAKTNYLNVYAPNTVTLVNTSVRAVQMQEAINIYRFYKATPFCTSRCSEAQIGCSASECG